ncbi:hypothetical protein EV385_6599 [Krasilnikovia cinnamomea]|uniref:Uncharacterized protein n=1 Tax=Krasilnikovia cinnamomea TaxID=349313 RepID=A0A4Q7Z9H7_9ACTN|nr:hypothetical protein [Krasilnikovia cinnamomea]RZU46525.1 hypothetical protein EV385_6599 [Krasilnikovia cinnamomea]
MTHQAQPNPFGMGPIAGDDREQRLTHLQGVADEHSRAERLAVLGEQELLVVAELLDELNALTNPDGVARDGWGRLARMMAMRIYDRLGI